MNPFLPLVLTLTIGQSSLTAVQAAMEGLPQVFIQDRLVMTIRTEAAGMTPHQRADAVRRRLGPILTLPNLSAEDVEIRQDHPYQTAAIYVRDRLLITVDRGLAKANSTTPSVLAEQWAATLREVLPEVNVAVSVPTGPQVVVQNRILMSIPAGADGLTPEERADVVRRRLGPILALPDIVPEDIEVRQREPGQTAAIYVRGLPLISVDQTLAEAHGTTTEELARTWAERLREVLPQIRVSVRNTVTVILPPADESSN
jgi:hypothetical protein